MSNYQLLIFKKMTEPDKKLISLILGLPFIIAILYYIFR